MVATASSCSRRWQWSWAAAAVAGGGGGGQRPIGGGQQAVGGGERQVVLLVLEVHACIAEDAQHFRHLVVLLIRTFRFNNMLLEKRGAMIVRRLCVLLDAERVYREFSEVLKDEKDLDFASTMALNLILLTSSELTNLRNLVKQSLINPTGKDLFLCLYCSWCHSPMGMISLCLLAQAYQHASAVIRSLGEEDINVKLLMQLDKLIRLLEAPIFTYLRLQLLDPTRYPWLLKTLYGLLKLLPQQSAAFKILKTRLKTLPPHTLSLDQVKWTSSGNPNTQILKVADCNCLDEGNMHTAIDFASRLQQFKSMQSKHRIYTRIMLFPVRDANI